MVMCNAEITTKVIFFIMGFTPISLQFQPPSILYRAYKWPKILIEQNKFIFYGMVCLKQINFKPPDLFYCFKHFPQVFYTYSVTICIILSSLIITECPIQN